MSARPILAGWASASAMLLAACSSPPPAPDWQLDMESALDAYARHRLAGRLDLADRDFARAVDAVSATGRPDLLARVRLVRCAVASAALDFAVCPEPREIAREAGPEEQAYAAYLAGAWDGIDAARLPLVHAAVVRAGDDAGRLAAVRAIDATTSRLVAAAALFRRGALPPSGIDVAVDAASGSGQRGALLPWLGVQEKAAVTAGDTARAAAIRRRIEVATPP
jgi:hypothetical protein